jgi:Flp pilus assembly protein TadB
MALTEKTGSPHAPTAAHRQTDVNREEIEEVAVLAPGILLRGAEVAVAVLIGLLVCPPLAILAVVVVVPSLAVAIVVGLLAAIVAMPYLLVRHVREHHRAHRSSVLAHGLQRLRVRKARRAATDGRLKSTDVGQP